VSGRPCRRAAVTCHRAASATGPGRDPFAVAGMRLAR